MTLCTEGLDIGYYHNAITQKHCFNGMHTVIIMFAVIICLFQLPDGYQIVAEELVQVWVCMDQGTVEEVELKEDIYPTLLLILSLDHRTRIYCYGLERDPPEDEGGAGYEEKKHAYLKLLCA